ncbi:hypothetical protein ACFLYK_03290 [Candidatus Cloacimonadota bacterium]
MIYKAAVFIFLLLISCSGDDILNKDTIPPVKPHMIQHLGDTGDQIGGEVINYYVNDELEFNGIDAVSGEEWIRIQWERVSDEDADLIEIYRFNLNDYNYYLDNIDDLGEEYDFSTLVDTLESTESSYYVDSSPGLLGYNWFYFIKVLDEAGNSATSDTVCYRLVNRPAILYPGNGIVNHDELIFGWELDSGFSPSQSRLLLFSQDRELLWVYNPLDFDGTQIEYSGQYLLPQTLIWRVDVFAEDLFYNVQGKIYHMYSGSESIETVLYLE